MTYSRGTDNDKAARLIIYEDGVPLAICYSATCDVDDLNRIINRANTTEAMVKALKNILHQAELTARIFPNAPGRGDWESVTREATAALKRVALDDARPIPSPAAPNR